MLSNNYFSEKLPNKVMHSKKIYLVRRSLPNEESLNISDSNNLSQNIFHVKYEQGQGHNLNPPAHQICGGLAAFNKVKDELEENNNQIDQNMKSVELNSFQKFKMQFQYMRKASQSYQQEQEPLEEDIQIFGKQQVYEPQLLVTQDLEEEIRKTVSRISDLKNREYLSRNERALKNYQKYSNRWKVQLNKSESITKRSKDESIYRIADEYRQKEEKKLLLDYIQYKIERDGNEYWKKNLRTGCTSREQQEECKQIEFIRSPHLPQNRPLTGFDDNPYFNRKIQERKQKVKNVLPMDQKINISGLFVGGQSKLEEEIKYVRKLVNQNFQTELNKKKRYEKMNNNLSQSINETIASKWDKKTKLQNRYDKIF